MTDIPKIIALDYGRQRIGVALSFGTLAEPLTVIANNEHAIENIEQIIHEHQVGKIVVGVSQRLMAKESEIFGRQIATTLNLPLVLVDENLSSIEAKKRLHEKDLGKKKYKGEIDHFAAAIFLQNYLNEEYS